MTKIKEQTPKNSSGTAIRDIIRLASDADGLTPDDCGKLIERHGNSSAVNEAVAIFKDMVVTGQNEREHLKAIQFRIS